MMRTMSKLAIVLAGAVLLAGGAGAAEPQKVWEVKGLDAPESAVPDPNRDVIYVSNVNGQPGEANGKGYIAKLSTDGKIISKHWVTGLNAPKGLALHEGKLYAADIDKLVVVDTGSGKIAATYDAPGAAFLNDVTAADDGRIFVSDMVKNQIWVLDGPLFQLWLESPELQNPNGLLAEPNRLVVASWGDMNPQDFSTKIPGHLKAVDYQTMKITDLGTEPIGNLDGIEPDGNGGYLVTDWVKGALYRIDDNGNGKMLMDMDQGSADLHYDPSQNLAIIPIMGDNVVVAYRL